MIINRSGIAIRMEVESLRVMGRATQGVPNQNCDDDTIAAVAKVLRDDENVQDVEDIEVDMTSYSIDPKFH